MVDFKTTIDYNNILIKAQLNYIATVSISETHSKRPVCIKVSERYYIKTSGSESRPRKVELTHAFKKTQRLP